MRNQPDAPEIDVAPEPEDGMVKAVAHLREKYDEEAQVLWRVSGPRKVGATPSAVSAIGSVLVAFDGRPERVIVQAFESGSYRLFREYKEPVVAPDKDKTAGALGTTLPGAKPGDDA